MKTWKKVVIASSVTMIVGIGVYYIIQSQRIKKIRDRGFIINVSTVQDKRGPVQTFPEDSNGNDTIPVANSASEFSNIFTKLISSLFNK